MKISLTEHPAKALREAAGILTFIAAGLLFYRAVGKVGWQDDVPWHTLNGLQILQTHTVSLKDTWTWKTPNHPWGDAEWLWDLCTAWIYLHFGWFGIRLTVVGIMELLLFSLWRYARAYQPLSVLIPLSLMASLVWVLTTQARPQIMSYLFFAWALLSIEKARAKGTQHPLWFFLPVLVLWNNIHGSAILWLGLLLLEAVFAGKEAWRYLGLVLVSMALLFLRPAALAMVPFVSQQFSTTNLMIDEWLSPNFHQTANMFVLGAGILLCGSVWSKTTLREKSWLVFGWVAYFFAQRFSPYAMILTWVVFVRAFKAPARLYRNQFLPLLAGSLLAVFFLSGFTALNTPFAAPREVGATRYLVAHHIHQVVNEYDMGGTLEFYGIKAMADGRALWAGEAWFYQYFLVNLNQVPMATFLKEQAPGIHAVVWSDGGLDAYQMDHIPGWSKVYDDKKVSVWQKKMQ